MNLYYFFLKEFNEKKKLVFDNSVYTYKDLKFNINLADIYLSKIKKKNSILVLTENSYHLGILFLTVAKIGKTIIPLNKELKEKQILKQILYISPDLIIYSPIFEKIVKKIGKSNLISTKQIFKRNLKKDSLNKIKLHKKNYIKKNFIVTFSSGTTSNPKPILFTQKIKYLRYKHIKKLYAVTKKDVILTSSPLDHSLGQRLFFLAVLTGCSLIYFNKYNLKIWKKIIKRYNVSFAILPSNYLKLLKKDILTNKVKIPKIVSAASDISKIEKLALKKKINFNEMYGASEIGTITNLNKNSPLEKIDSVGKVLYNAKVKIFGKNNKQLPVYKMGEIGCKTNLQFNGYFKNKKLTDISKFKGFFLTGDLGYLDRDNYLYFVSRKKDVIISSGLNIYPADIEKEINAHANIKESAVIGVKDQFFGEVVFAVCILKKKKKNFELNLRNFLSNRLANFQQPLGYTFVKTLPKNTIGKVLKRDLKEIYNKKNLDFSKNLRSLLN